MSEAPVKPAQKIPAAFLRKAKSRLTRFCMADNTGVSLRYVDFLAQVLFFARYVIARGIADSKASRVGVLFHSSTMSATVNFALFFAGKAPVNLNPKSSRDRLLSLIQQCGIHKVITSRAFIQQMKIQEMAEMVFIEDLLMPGIQKKQKWFRLAAFIFPAFVLEWAFLHKPQAVDDEATVVFSNTSTDEPQGIVLTHRNIYRAAEALGVSIESSSRDCLFAGIPFMQAMGFTSCLCFPLVSGTGVLYHGVPLMAEEVGAMIRQYQATLFFGIPLLFSAYVRKCSPADFASIVTAVAGTEKLRKNVTKEFFKKFDVVPFLSYGPAEVCGLLTIGIPEYLDDHSLKHLRRITRRVGMPLPGVEVKIVDPETFQEVPREKQGMILARGEVVMQGYLNHPEKTQEVMHDGWFLTNDIGSMDLNGRVKIEDKLHRFSFIGGEKIPHAAVEEEILDAMGASEQICVVTAVHTEQGTEKIVVLYERDVNVDHLREKILKRNNIPKSWVPKEGCYYEIPEIPYTDSGRPDWIKIKERARLMDLVHVSGENFIEVTIETRDGTLIALNHFRRGSDRVVILAHGWRNSKDTYLFKKMSGMFSLDYDVICFDFRGHGRSSGVFSWTTEEPEDLRAVVEYAKRNEYRKVAVMGFSLGAAIAIIEASQNHDVDSVIAVSGPTEFRRIDFHFWEREMLNDIKLLIGPKGRGRDVRPGNPFREKIRPIDVVDRISPTPILFIHGEKDWLIKPYHSEELFKKAKPPKRIVLIKEAGHADKIYDTSSREFEQACYDWLDETLK